MFYIVKLLIRYIHQFFCIPDNDSNKSSNISLETLNGGVVDEGYDSESDYISLPYLDEHEPYYDVNIPTDKLN